jgi:hypothetical protein
MPWFYASVQHLPGHRFKRSTISIGVKTFFRLIFTGKTFYSEGADRAIVFHKRPLEIYNDYLYNDDSYPMALEELRNFLRQNDKLSAGTLVASYAVPQDTKCIFSRTPNGGGFSIDPVLYFSPGSEEHIALEKKIIEISRKYGARPHLNKVTNLSADLIRNGYDKNVIASYLEWCNKKDPKGIFQGKFYQMLNEAVKGSKNDGE